MTPCTQNSSWSLSALGRDIFETKQGFPSGHGTTRSHPQWGCRGASRSDGGLGITAIAPFRIVRVGGCYFLVELVHQDRVEPSAYIRGIAGAGVLWIVAVGALGAARAQLVRDVSGGGAEALQRAIVEVGHVRHCRAMEDTRSKSRFSVFEQGQGRVSSSGERSRDLHKTHGEASWGAVSSRAPLIMARKAKFHRSWTACAVRTTWQLFGYVCLRETHVLCGAHSAPRQLLTSNEY